MPDFTENNTQGFTLIELSIVLVIIGLVIAGIVGGQHLISNAKMRSVITETNGFRVAVRTFEMQYDALPGDMANAYDYWGSECNTNANNCNGNGDRLLTSTVERLGFFQHLSLAQMLNGSFSGKKVTTDIVFGENTPTAKIGGGGYWARDCPSPDTEYNCILLASQNLATQLMGAIVKPKDAAYIDIKTDDGTSTTGSILTQRGSGLSNPQCVEGGSATYNLDEDEVTCRIHFKLELF